MKLKMNYMKLKNGKIKLNEKVKNMNYVNVNMIFNIMKQ